jgi:glycosyltransferase involved in cell wall biosynthesis
VKACWRVLVVHNAYQQRGGEDSVVEAEVALLEGRGHEVLLYRRDNSDIAHVAKLDLLARTFWSRRSTRDLARAVREFSPDVMHVHNTFPLISPSIYWAASRLRLPVVQTLHNFRLLCPQAMFLRDGHVCEDCLGHLPWRGVVRRCYRDSLTQSGTLASMLSMHRAFGTWQHKVTRYIALNEFCRSKFIAGGLPESRIAVKPNFVDVPSPGEEARRDGLFVGRLSPEKGIAVLLGAVGRLPDVVVDVVGTGPEEKAVAANPRLLVHGARSPADVLAAMRQAAYLVMPSIWYENFPRTLVEAFACGLPVIASRLGAMAELIEDGRTGLMFAPGDADDLAQKIAWAERHPDAMRAMGENARCEYAAKYTPEINYRQLMAIYDQAIGEVAHG